MSTISPSGGPPSPSLEKTILCDLLLEIVGRNTGRMATARRHAHVLDAAIPHMTMPQRQEAVRRIRRIETKWGPQFPGDENKPENAEILPETRVALWLSTRKVPERYLRILLRAANKISDGETSLSEIMDYAFAAEIDHVIIPVGFDSFKEWMLELRIARRTSKGVYLPGPMCGWWVDKMKPSKEKSSPYAACLEQREKMRSRQKAFS